MEFDQVYNQLKMIMSPYQNKLVLVEDKKDSYYLDTNYIMANKKPMFFGAIKINKAYVSYHLMPVYLYPELLSQLSPELKKRMQGKSCFNFKTTDKMLFAELKKLTKRGFNKYKQAGFL